MSTRQALADSSKSSRYSVEASRTRLPASDTWCSRESVGCTKCPRLLVGPQGFEPWTDGLKVSGSSLKTARKMHQKRTKQRRFQATSQIQNGDNGDT